MSSTLFARMGQQALAQGGSATHFLLTALAVCFGRTHADSGEVMFGLERTNRHIAGQQTCFGALARTMPVGIRLDAGDDFAAGMRRVVEEIHRCALHEQFPVVRLREAAGANDRLFDLSLSVRDAVVEGADAGLAPVVLHPGLQGAPLALVLRPGTGRARGMGLEFHFDSAVLERAEMERIQKRVALLSEAVVKGAQGPVSALPLMSDDERRQVLVAWNDTARDYSQDLCIHELFEQQAARTPQAVAVEHEGRSLSYRELNEQANQLAHHLREMGVGPDDRVALTCVRRSPEMVVGILAVLKAGGAYVPLDPTYPRKRLQYMLRDSAPTMALVDMAGQLALAPAGPEPSGVAMLHLCDEASRWSQTPAANLPRQALRLGRHHLAYVIYTSGSTGQPKGVMVKHGGLTNLALAQIEAFGIEPGNCVLQFASFSFDACVSELVFTLCRGATLCLAAHAHLIPGEPLLNVLRNSRITCVTLPPIALAALPTQEGFETLECIIVAGEACPPELAARWARGRRFINAYGPTETTVCATAYSYPGGPHAVLLIGRPIGNMHIYGSTVCHADDTEANSLLAERRAAVASMRAPFLQAERQHQANIGLAEQKFISETALESSRTTMETARAQLQAAEAQLTSGRLALRETALVTPIRGLVSKRQALPSEKLSLEQLVVTIVDLSRLELAGVVAPHEVGRLAEGLPVEVRIEGVAEPVAGRIARIAPAVEPGTRAVGVAVTLPNPQEALRAGQYAVARVVLADPAQRLTLPLEAVSHSAGQTHVWVIEKGALMRRAVTTGRHDMARGRIEVLGGLAPQASVLAASFDNLREGAQATVAARPASASGDSSH